MFSSPVQCHFTRSVGRTETLKDEVVAAVTEVSLVVDSLTPDLTADLGDNIAGHCFTDENQIRDEFTKLDFRLRERQQKVTVRMAKGAGVHVILRHVRIPSLTVKKRGEDPGEEVERKSKKVAPTSETLRATLNLLVLPETSQTREFLLLMVGKTFFFEFQDEQEEFDFGPPPDAAKKKDDGQGKLQLVKNSKTRRVTDQAVAEKLAEIDVQLKPAELAAMDDTQRDTTIAWVEAYQHSRERNLAPLPSPPDFIANPRLLVPPVPDPVAGDVLNERATTKKPRARVGKFSNTVGDQTKAKRKKKGGVH
jgi:hypothetical protein